MKNIKTFENYNKQPDIGDFVICNPPSISSNFDSDKKFINFINNNIGQIVGIGNFQNLNTIISTESIYNIEYNNIPKNLKPYFNMSCKTFTKKQLIFFSPNLEETQKELELLQNVNNFNM